MCALTNHNSARVRAWKTRVRARGNRKFTVFPRIFQIHRLNSKTSPMKMIFSEFHRTFGTSTALLGLSPANHRTFGPFTALLGFHRTFHRTFGVSSHFWDFHRTFGSFSAPGAIFTGAPRGVSRVSLGCLRGVSGVSHRGSQGCL